MKLGARVLKTGLAVAVAMYTALIFDFTSAVFAGIAAVFSIQPSIYRSFQTIIEQVEANLLGAITAILMVYLLGNDPFIIGFTIILVITICIGFGMKQEIIMLAVVSVIAIMESTDMPFVEFAFTRFSSVFIGIIAAFLVNLIFLPPKYETKLFKQIEHTSNEILQWIRITSRNLSDQPALKDEIKKLIEDITKLDHTYLLYSEERIYSKRSRYSRARKLVLFRQLIHSAKKSLEVLRTLHRYDQELEHLSKEMKNRFVQEIDYLMHTHEKLIMKCMGKIREHEEKVHQPFESNMTNLIEELIDHTSQLKDRSKQLQFLPLAAKLMDYDHQLEHLKKLIDSYQQYHKKEQINTELRDL
ncbi:FUSC family protein [Salinibacillus xinjiangensis]|uniref:Aromatic acid exporter family protein n=1 Tax=Salinibacillus xinjiangensis TaxID=1229268 RepID=A0A6G1X9F3_9BACI|nr:aromatic acid exporter family protein [Salinibacillus xinjiangensis]MRG87535.1 aromatic acid exporter family protein [Salinibacillus xinjiangensis]